MKNLAGFIVVIFITFLVIGCGGSGGSTTGGNDGPLVKIKDINGKWHVHTHVTDFTYGKCKKEVDSDIEFSQDGNYIKYIKSDGEIKFYYKDLMPGYCEVEELNENFFKDFKNAENFILDGEKHCIDNKDLFDKASDVRACKTIKVYSQNSFNETNRVYITFKNGIKGEVEWERKFTR